MQRISAKQILERIKQENPWWSESKTLPEFYQGMIPRPYLDLLYPLIKQESAKRTVVLMGPRRVGKTVLIHHLISQLVNNGINSQNICYISVDHPIYNGLTLDDFIKAYAEAISKRILNDKCYVFFDEIQYLKDWEKHLKSLTDSYSNFTFLASGSAAAALRLKSTESGAGRFTDFLLPPLTFYEYLTLTSQTDLVQVAKKDRREFLTKNIDSLNSLFIEYLNFGGYPEVIFSETIKSDMGRFVKSDIIDKVLLRDLPQLYGIQDIQELNYLFTNLAFNTAGEVSLDELSKNSGVAKNTIKKYIEYLEAAFLIKIVHRIDRTAKRFKRANYFKVYLTNPSMRSALFSPISGDDPALGSLVETAIFSQWFHSQSHLHYARWKGGEVDIVSLGSEVKPRWAVEVKWSDRFFDHPQELKSLTQFCKTHKLLYALVTTKTARGKKAIFNTDVEYIPACLYCYGLGYNIIKSKSDLK